MLTAVGLPLLEQLDTALTRVHRYVRAWRAALEGDCWADLEAAGCTAAPACGGAA